jgi:hypothetical protein
MKRLVLSAAAATLLSGFALSASAEAAPFHRHGLTAYERATIARSQRQLYVVKARARADRHVTLWERAKIRVAQARHNALVYRLRHN